MRVRRRRGLTTRIRYSTAGCQGVFPDMFEVSESLQLLVRLPSKFVEFIQGVRRHCRLRFHFKQKQVVEKIIDDVLDCSHRGFEGLQLLRLDLNFVSLPPSPQINSKGYGDQHKAD